MIQDSIAMAAKLMHNVEAAGKTVTPGIIAYYTIQHIRSGRRSAGSSVVDAMKRKIGQRYRSFTMMWSPRRPIIIGSKLASLAAETRNSGPKLKVTFAKPSRLRYREGAMPQHKSALTMSGACHSNQRQSNICDVINCPGTARAWCVAIERASWDAIHIWVGSFLDRRTTREPTGANTFRVAWQEAFSQRPSAVVDR